MQIVSKRSSLARKRWQGKFLAALRRSPDVTRACKHAGISRQTAYRWKAESPEASQLWQNALDASLDRLEGRAFELAEKGDASLLQWLLRSHRPQVYRETTRTEVGIAAKIVLIPAKAEGDE